MALILDVGKWVWDIVAGVEVCELRHSLEECAEDSKAGAVIVIITANAKFNNLTKVYLGPCARALSLFEESGQDNVHLFAGTFNAECCQGVSLQVDAAEYLDYLLRRALFLLVSWCKNKNK